MRSATDVFRDFEAVLCKINRVQMTDCRLAVNCEQNWQWNGQETRLHHQNSIIQQASKVLLTSTTAIKVLINFINLVLKVISRNHKGSAIVSFLSRINPIPRIDTCFLRSILILSSYLGLGLLNGLFPVGLPIKNLKVGLPFSILATWPAHLYLLDIIALTIRGWSEKFPT